MRTKKICRGGGEVGAGFVSDSAHRASWILSLSFIDNLMFNKEIFFMFLSSPAMLDQFY